VTVLTFFACAVFLIVVVGTLVPRRPAIGRPKPARAVISEAQEAVWVFDAWLRNSSTDQDALDRLDGPERPYGDGGSIT
jgi:hypothetical protein